MNYCELLQQYTTLKMPCVCQRPIFCEILWVGKPQLSTSIYLCMYIAVKLAILNLEKRFKAK